VHYSTIQTTSSIGPTVNKNLQLYNVSTGPSGIGLVGTQVSRNSWRLKCHQKEELNMYTDLGDLQRHFLYIFLLSVILV